MKHVLFSAILFSFLGTTMAFGADENMKQADALFEKKLYQQALKKYEDVVAHAASDTAKNRALYRSIECEALLFRYGEAAQRLYAFKVPSDLRWEARFLILRTEVGREFLKDYGSLTSKDKIEGAEKDVLSWTETQWRASIDADYEKLHAKREELLRLKTADESDFIKTQKTDIDLAPTLWDFALLNWTDYLISDSKNKTGERAVALMEEASQMPKSGRALAAERWKLNALLLRLDNPSLFKPVPDQEAADKRAMETLKQYMKSFSVGRNKALAAYRLGTLLEKYKKYKEAVEVCEEGAKAGGLSLEGENCDDLRSSIIKPQLNVSSEFAPLDGKKALRVSARNLTEIYLRTYQTSPDELRELLKSTGWYGNGPALNHDPLRGLYGEKEVTEILKKTPEKTWSLKIPPVGPYEYSEFDADVEGLKPGFHVVVATSDPHFRPGNSLFTAAVLNFTDLILVSHGGLKERISSWFKSQHPSKNFAMYNYVLNAVTGLPVNDAKVDGFYSSSGSNSNFSGVTDADGRAEFYFPVHQDYQWGSADPMATYQNRYALLASSVGFSAPYVQRFEVHLETDRPIYRPGQKVQGRAVVIERTANGFQVLRDKVKLTLYARDNNGQNFYNTSLDPNDMGSARFEFEIPAGRLLGRYYVEASFNLEGKSFSGSTQFSVEEYKRPEFEVKIDDAEGPWKLGRKVKVGGSAKYYFGGAVSDGVVTYRVSREQFVPWFCWWWRSFFRGGEKTEVAQGSIKTDAEGRFHFDFTPQPDEDEREFPFRYTVEADVRDPGGRTLTGEKTFMASKQALFFDIPLKTGFFHVKPAPSVTVRLVDINEKPSESTGTYAVYKLAAPVEVEKTGPIRDSFDIQSAYSKVKDGPQAAHGKVQFSKNGTPLSLEGLQEGVYRLKLEASDPWGGKTEQSIVFVAVENGHEKTSLDIPYFSASQFPSYVQGETAEFLFGSSQAKGKAVVEIWADGSLLSRRLIDAGVNLLKVPVTADYKGGFTFRWFAAGDYKFRAGDINVEVPWKDRELKLSLDYDKTLAPGQQTAWTLHASDDSGKTVDGEASVKMFDRSLEYYVKSTGSWVTGIYGRLSASLAKEDSIFLARFYSLPIAENWLRKMYSIFKKRIVQDLPPPSLRLNFSRVYPRRRGIMFRGGMGGEFAEDSLADMNMAAAAPMGMAAKKEDREYKSASEKPKPAIQGEPAAPPPPGGDNVEVRQNFSETAFYEPQLKIKNGSAKFGFKVPDQLTSWKIESTVLTGDVKYGYLSEETVTKKDLMVRVEIPRFFREKDAGTLKAVIHNETPSNLSGQVTLTAAELGLKNPVKDFHVGAHGQATLSWPVKVPAGTGLIKIRAVARAGHLVDAEERELPILPSRQRLIESRTEILDGNAAETLKLPSFEKADPTRESELLQLEINPQLALSLLNTIPYLQHYPYECTEQVLNRFVPAAIINEIFKRYPDLAAAVKKIPPRDTLTPAWDRNDPKRLMTLLETPWEEISKGRQAFFLQNSVDPKAVKFETEDGLKKLASYQLNDGGFPWFPGGHADAYMTLYVLEGFSQAKRFNVSLDPSIINKAYNYVLQEIPRRLMPDEGNTSLILYAAYILTSFDNFKNNADAEALIRKWAEFADKHSDALTVLGKAYAAQVWWNLGEKEKGDAYWRRVMDGAREDKLTGVYWTPEKTSWMWYSDTVETHAFLLRTLMKHNPADPHVTGMVKWLLFNRKGNEWKSTKASAAAIYSLLDVLKRRGALDKEEKFTVHWDKVKDTVSVGPTEWLSKPLRWTLSNAEIPAKPKPVEISKQGPGFAFASLTWIFSTDELPEKAVSGDVIDLNRKFYLRVKDGEGYTLKPLSNGATVEVGDQIEVELKVNTKSQFEYVHILDPRPAGFESETLLSRWNWDKLIYYEEPRDSLMNFFVSWLPHGEYKLKHRFRATTPGTYRVGSAVIQSMYAPEFSAYSSGLIINVK